MLHTIIEKNSYHDSIVLMLLTNHLKEIAGVNNVQVMMGTPANKDIFKTGGLATPELDQATPNDMVVVVDVDDEALIDQVVAESKNYLEEQSQAKEDEGTTERVRTWDKALEVGKDAPLALISIPGVYAAPEIERALDAGKHVFCFSDNVSIEDEARLKKLAHEKGLLLMGPDCGTGVANGIPLAFANRTRRGEIGIVGASGTGIQEVATTIHKLGGGVTNAIGTGGRDLKAAVDGTTLKDGVALLDQDPSVKVIVVISKPPAKEVRDSVMDLLRAAHKPVVVVFMGERPDHHEEGLYQAYTLEETAHLAVDLLNGQQPTAVAEELPVPDVKLAEGQKNIKAYYSGGTLAYEAATMINDTVGLNAESGVDGAILNQDGYEVLDLGDDVYTQGRPHPMIDATVRKQMMTDAGQDPETAVILIDDVLGYGTHDDMAGELAPTIKKVIADAKAQGRELPVVATIVGTDLDIQDCAGQKKTLEEAGAVVCQSNAQAVKVALALIGHPVEEVVKDVEPKKATNVTMPEVPESLRKLLTVDRFVNIGVESFAKAIDENGGRAVQFDWQPIAGGNVELQRALAFLNKVSLETEV
ncbi:acyl-CoA synthetase FdrA [Limosilactobacillus fermentum]|uniref:Acyl-CoA synthetase FdrA n=1 Tax=Limosilactobacillus fermentum TaxID=1613 RepID=A0AAJ6A179_LIMFE|nr:acyl-CoA synthetase FdrA [Limosilactobacillus fermentum]MED7635720.1 acyl-CoA synthetase FdrA [Limosilactobacillus fermentum]PTV36718.1 acyl-CoA synthetase FdrA [Limosilactobacillus fermentum]QAR24040.1 acyl-CoA synthetase FdrA [Limosilactobacillus fermentum]UVW03065.1 acyl-CoA synthetase FdrA [Limosilactobacillus fermentum]WEN05532.1 acyl-CoA synthetase FdrA [Limosilactobacillus fermentum]